MKKNKKTHLIQGLIITACVSASPCLVAGEDAQSASVFELSLQELLQVKVRVPGAITRMSLVQQPSSVTTLTASDIQLTSARNLLDLIEAHVPGAFWMESELGPLLGMRGSLVGRNLKYLLLVNGRVMNSKGFFGAITELEQWDLRDLEKIEVIRGPGSVTYGPGAVSGVISITTKSASAKSNNFVSLQYNHEYDSVGGSYSHNHQLAKGNLFTFASVTRTKGAQASQFLVDDVDEFGFVGEDFLLDDEPLDYFSDYQDEPQAKLMFDWRMSSDWRLWARYTQQGAAWKGNEVKTDFDGELLNQQGTRARQWSLSLENNHEIRPGLNVSSVISADSLDGERRVGSQRFPDPDSVLNFRVNYAETEVFLKTQFNWSLENNLQTALGLEYSWDEYGAGWGDSEQEMRMGDNADIVNGPDSLAILDGSKGSADRNGPPIFVGKGWSTDSFAVVAELNKTFANSNQLLLSARLDKSANSDWLPSPRLAYSFALDSTQYIHFILQRSRRLNNAGQNLVSSLAGEEPANESLTNFEVNYAGYWSSGHSFKLAVFYNDAEILSWNGDENAVLFVGDQKVAGLEADYTFEWENGKFFINYAYTDQLDWQLSDELNRSGISYSDYNQPIEDTTSVIEGFGNAINNWPVQALKSTVRWNASDRVTLQVSARFLWDFQGARDGLTALEIAAAGEPFEADTMAAINRVRQEGAYDEDLRLSGSAHFEIKPSLQLSFYLQNILGTNDSKRYAEDSGNEDLVPRKTRFTEEPASVSVRMQYNF